MINTWASSHLLKYFCELHQLGQYSVASSLWKPTGGVTAAPELCLMSGDLLVDFQANTF